MDDPYCPAIKKDGTKCLAFKAAGLNTCVSHDAESLAKRRPPDGRWKMVNGKYSKVYDDGRIVSPYG